MYVLIVFDRYDPGDVAAVLGPFATSDEVQRARGETVAADEQRFRKTSIRRVHPDLPAHAA